LRAALLAKTKKLELHEEATGLPAAFSLEGSGWGTALKWANWLFWFNLPLLFFHVVYFLTQRVPI
jgi:hypothetical protein